MKIAVAVKVVPDDQDIQVSNDGTLDFSKARFVVSEYDLNALEAASQLAASMGCPAIAVTVGPKGIDDSKLKKNILARGIDELHLVADDAFDGMDAYATAQALATLLEQVPDCDLVVCGDGSADLYAKQTGAQLAARLDLPYVAGAVSLECIEATLLCKRKVEDEVESLEVPLPAVVSVLPEAAVPRICGMKDILAAGKKPANVSAAENAPEAMLEVVACKAPEQTDRKNDVIDASEDGAIEKFAAAIKAAL